MTRISDIRRPPDVSPVAVFSKKQMPWAPAQGIISFGGEGGI